jgi:signal transduction histidine kinase
MRSFACFFVSCAVLSPWLLPSGRTESGPAETSRVVTLTAEEGAWVAAHPIIRAGHDPLYSPYAMQNTVGQIVGIDADYLELISQRTGLKFQNEIRRDWGRMIEDFKAGQVDLLLSLGHAPEREQYLTYTRSYAFTANVIITRSDAPNLSTLGDLKDHTIGIPRGSPGLRRDLEASAPGTVVVEYETPAACYQAVARGEVYASIGDVANASYLIKLHRLTNLRFGRVLSTSSPIFIGVRKDWPLLVTIINKALADISAADRQRISNRWIVAESSTDLRWAKAFKVAAAIAAVAVLVFLLAFLHNRRLARELAERRRIQAELEQTRDRLMLASKERRELMHMVAHDLRGPLSAIQLGTELLRLNPPLIEASRVITVQRIGESADHMGRLINDLLSAQNVDEGRYLLSVTAGDVGQLVRSAIAALETVAQHKRIAVKARLPAGAVPLNTDFVALQQVVDNLLSNALKYSPLDTWVEIAVTATAAHCRFEVRDQGPGVKPEEREKIFEKYSRGSAQPTHGEESIGLGLWIVRRFVTALQGRVWCESAPGTAGAVFIVEVPLSPPPAV